MPSFAFSPNEINDLADKLSGPLLARINAALHQSTQASRQSLKQLTVADVAQLAQFSEKTILKFIREGRLRARNHGTHEKPQWRVTESDYQSFINS